MRDSDVRAAVLRMLSRRHAHDSTTRIVEEMGVWSGSARIDVAVINGELNGYELKSNSDTLERLPQQADLYSRVFDHLTLVVGTKHSAKAAELLPEWWSVLMAHERGGSLRLEPVRIGDRNPCREPFFVAQLLWRNEALTILDKLGLAEGWRSKTAPAVHRHLSESLPLADLAAHVRETLRRREGWLGHSVEDVLNVTVQC